MSQNSQNSNNSSEDDKPKNIAVWRIAMATICFSGIQFGWALQISQLTPFVLLLKLPKSLVSLVWLCGPVAGLVVQPIVGALSDRTRSSFGRRRPYILVGSIIVVFSLLLIPNSIEFGRLFGDSSDTTTAALALAVIGFWLLDFSNNMLQGPCRALVADMVGPKQQELGNSIFSVWLAVGNVTGYIAGWVNWSYYFPFAMSSACTEACANLRVSFTMSIVFLIITVALTLFVSKEKTLQEVELEQGGAEQPKGNAIVNLFKTILIMPSSMKRVCLVQFFAWFGWFAFLLYGTDWVGENIYHGNPSGTRSEIDKFNEGVRWGSFGLAGFATVSLFVSPIVPYLTRAFGVKTIYAIGNVCLSLVLFAPYFVTKSRYAVIAVLSFFGIPWSITMTIPFAIAANSAPEKEKGIYLGILNIFVVLPQFCMGLAGVIFSRFFGPNIIPVFIAGSISALISALLVFILIIPNKMIDHPRKRRASLSTIRVKSTSPETPYLSV
ncbi:hypothetical protein AKO1_011902, partial [Acrasis kona]